MGGNYWAVYATDAQGKRWRVNGGMCRRAGELMVDNDVLGVKAAGGHYQLLYDKPRPSAWEPAQVPYTGRSSIGRAGAATYLGHANGGPVKRFTRAEIAALRGDPGKASS
jgi:hypothetical protein